MGGSEEIIWIKLVLKKRLFVLSVCLLFVLGS